VKSEFITSVIRTEKTYNCQAQHQFGIGGAREGSELTEDWCGRIGPWQTPVYLIIPEVVDGEVPQHIRRDRGVGGVQDHAPEDEESGLTEHKRF